jgi:hypothetical protein
MDNADWEHVTRTTVNQANKLGLNRSGFDGDSKV